MILYSSDAEADRVFLRDLLGLAHVDAGNGWLIMALPPGEVAVHPAETSGAAELYLVCDDVAQTAAQCRLDTPQQAVDDVGHQPPAVRILRAVEHRQP